jgi:pimeloyl-ACP methyl ester carboxylesterase
MGDKDMTTHLMLKMRRRSLAAALVAITIATGVTATALASSTQPRAAKSQKPTIVLVHGGWADSSGWNEQVTKLQRLGYPVIAPANPLRGLSSDADYLRSVLRTIETPIVLVGHSYGGAVISNAAIGVPNVEALVYIAGFAPDKGESLLELVTMNPGSQIGPETLITRKYPTANGGEGTDLYLTKQGFRTAFAGDLPTTLADQMWAEQRPFSEEAFVSSSGEPAWKTIRSWYLVATQDRAIPPATQRFMADRAEATITQEKASHVPMISKPASTTNLILDAAEWVSSAN